MALRGGGKGPRLASVFRWAEVRADRDTSMSSSIREFILECRQGHVLPMIETQVLLHCKRGLSYGHRQIQKGAAVSMAPRNVNAFTHSTLESWGLQQEVPWGEGTWAALTVGIRDSSAR